MRLARGRDAFSQRHFISLEVDAQQVIAAHPRAAGDTGGDDAGRPAQAFRNSRFAPVDRRVELADGPWILRYRGFTLWVPSAISNRTTRPASSLICCEVGKAACPRFACADKRDLWVCHVGILDRVTFRPRDYRNWRAHRQVCASTCVHVTIPRTSIKNGGPLFLRNDPALTAFQQVILLRFSGSKA